MIYIHTPCETAVLARMLHAIIDASTYPTDGPWQTNPNLWQLDIHNDWWLSVDGGVHRVSHRNGQEKPAALAVWLRARFRFDVREEK